MTLEEYTNIINGMVSAPDTAPAVASSLIEAIKDDLGKLDAAAASIAAKEDQIRTLQDTNIKLFMSQSGNAATEEPEEEGPKSFEELIEERKESDE